MSRTVPKCCTCRQDELLIQLTINKGIFGGEKNTTTNVILNETTQWRSIRGDDVLVACLCNVVGLGACLEREREREERERRERERREERNREEK